MNTEFELFHGTNFSDLMRDIYHNSKKKSRQIDGLIKELQPLIKNSGDASVLVPMIKDYLEVSVKNDEHLVKLAGVIQRIISKSSGANEESMLLSESEKDELMSTLQDTVTDLQNESDRLESIKSKTISKGNK